MKNNIHLKGQLKLYMQWPAIMAILLIAMNVWMFSIDRNAGFVMCIFVLIYIVSAGLLYFHNKSLILTDMVDFASQ